MICKGCQGNLAYGNFPTPHARREVRGGRDAADFLGRQIGGGECGKFSFLFFYILFMGLDIESIRRGQGFEKERRGRGGEGEGGRVCLCMCVVCRVYRTLYD